MKRRNFSVGMAFSAFGFSAIFPKKSFALGEQGQMTAVFQQLEAKAQGRLGVHVIDTATGHEFGYRSDELFMMLSSFKLLASALVLARADRGEESLTRRIRYRKQDLVPWSPVTEAYADGEG